MIKSGYSRVLFHEKLYNPVYIYLSALWELNLKKYFLEVSFALQSLVTIKREGKDNGENTFWLLW